MQTARKALIRRGRLFAVGAAALTLAVAAAGCGSDDDDASAGNGSSTESAESADGKRVTMLALSTQCQFCAKVLDGAREAVTAGGAEIDVKQTAFDAAEQAQQANQTIAQKPDAVIVYPADATAILPSLQKLKQAGIKVVVVDSMPDRAQDDLWDAYRGAHDLRYGTSAAEAIVAGLKAKSKPLSGNLVVITGTPNSPATQLRLKAFEETLAKQAPNLKVVAKEPGNWDQTEAQTAAAGVFTRHGDGDLVGVYAQADNMLAGAITAAKRAGLDPKELVMVGSNCTIEGVEGIESGDQYATFLDDPKAEGKLAGEAALQLATGEEVKKYEFTPGPTITEKNTDECDAAIA